MSKQLPDYLRMHVNAAPMYISSSTDTITPPLCRITTA